MFTHMIGVVLLVPPCFLYISLAFLPTCNYGEKTSLFQRECASPPCCLYIKDVLQLQGGEGNSLWKREVFSNNYKLEGREGRCRDSKEEFNKVECACDEEFN